MLYNRGMINAMFAVEAVRTAQGKFGNKPLTGEQVRWGLENLDLDRRQDRQARLQGPADAAQGDLREPHRHRPRAGAPVGRQGMEIRLRLDRLRPEGGLADGRRSGAKKYAQEKNLPTDACSERRAEASAVGQPPTPSPPAAPRGEGRGGRGPRRGVARRQQHRGHLQPRHPGAQGRVARGARRVASSLCSAATAPARRRP